MSTRDLGALVKAYDVRGPMPELLDETVAQTLGAAFAQVVVLPEGASQVVVGRDMCESSPALARAMNEGVTQHGVDVVDVGVCSTDTLYFASGTLGVPGIMVTASHNPAGDNGLKLCRAEARPVWVESGLAEVHDLAQWRLDRGALHDIPAAQQPGIVSGQDVLQAYADHLHSLVDLAAVRPLTVVVDAGNGMAGRTAPVVLQREGLPVTLVPLYFELDGTFPNHPANPLEPANLRDLQGAVLEHGADLGLAFDGDADRCFVVDERGRAVSPSSITALIAEREIASEVARGRPAATVTVVHNLICSRVVPEVVEAAGARAVRTRVGHSVVKAEMAEHQAVFGGEHSAHYYFRDFWHADTGMLAALHVLAALGGQDRPLSALVAGYDRYAASGEINSVVADPAAATARVQAWGAGHGAGQDWLDGLTLSHLERPQWWVSVRRGHTEPLLRLNLEADDEATMAWVRDTVLVHRATGGSDMSEFVPPWVREVLRCPVGRHELVDATGDEGETVLECAADCGEPGLRRRYPVIDGIPVLLPDDATVVAR